MRNPLFEVRERKYEVYRKKIEGTSGGFDRDLYGNGTGSAIAEGIRPLQSILSDVERHIGELTINLDDIRKQIDLLHNLPVTNDPVIQELRALDLQGWTLHLNNGNCNLNI